jgi:hypothetical protein
MKGIAEYLEKFRSMQPADAYLKQVLIDIIGEVIGIELEPKDISVAGWTISLSVSPAAKGEIFMQKNRIQEKLVEKIPKFGGKYVIV